MGKVANVLVVFGDVLEARASTKYLFIDGRAVTLENRHTTLYNTHRDER